MRKNYNGEVIIGRVYQHSLKETVCQNQKSENYGKPYIAGKIEVAVDEEGLNVLTVRYKYISEYFKNGKVNSSFAFARQIINGKTWVEHGKDAALKVKLTPALGLNDFYLEDTDQIISAKENIGGFINLVEGALPPETDRNTFKADALLTNVKLIEADEEKHIDKDYLVVSGYIFDFRNSILPMDFTVRGKGGMDYFEKADISAEEPLYTGIWGRINNLTQKIEEVEESAFGEATVKTTEKHFKDWTITGANPNPYEYGEENVLTKEDIDKAIQDRQIALAKVKADRLTYVESKNGATVKPAETNPLEVLVSKNPEGSKSYVF